MRGNIEISGFDWVTRVYPGLQTTENRVDLREAVIEQDTRRTGAGFLRGSGSIGDGRL